MKFRVTMHNRNALYDACLDAERSSGTSENLREVCSKWFDRGEELTVEIDTEAKTCTVIEVGK